MEHNLPVLYQEFLKAANIYSERVAVIFNNGRGNIETVTYQRLLQEVSKVSTYLTTNELPIQSGCYICLFMEQEVCIPAIILGILSQNAAFVCLDNKSTAEHRSKIFCLLNVRWVFTIKNQNTSLILNLSQMEDLKKEFTVSGVVVELWEIGGAEIKENDPQFQTMAYAITTSGTCGNPKCVRVPHECITPNVLELRSILDVCSNDVIFMASPLTFDPWIVELFLAVTSGAAILIVPNAIKAAPSVLIEVLFPKIPSIYSGTTIMQCTPSVISRWPLKTVQNVVLGANSSLKALLLGGEPCPNIKTLKEWRSQNNATDIYNLYGITEVSCWASVHKIDFSKENTSGAVSLGVPFKETSLQVRDNTGEIVLNDGVGELFIGSATRVCSVDSESDVHRSYPLYRATGDIVKIDEKRNEIVYAYRKDDVIKRCGHRVNLAEIEKFAAQHEFVNSIHCVWDVSRKKLGIFINFLTSCQDIEKCITEIRLKIGKNLGQSSMPDLILNISKVPLTAHGKVNKKALCALMIDKLEHEQKKLADNCISSSIHAAFQELWHKYLCCSSILPNASFIAQGGNSFAALALFNDLEKLGYELPRTFIVNLLDGSTFEECCENLGKDYDTPIIRMVHKHKDEQTYAKKRKLTNRMKKVKAGSFPASTSSGAYYSMCRGQMIEHGRQDTTDTMITRISDLANICLGIVWTVDLGKCVDASPLLVQYSSNESKVVVGSHSHKLVIVEMVNGSDTVSSQMVELEDRIESSACVSSCGCYVFVGCYGGYVYCADIRTGTIRWKFKTGDVVKCSPCLCLDDTAIVVGSYDSTLHCLRIQDGKQLWSTQAGLNGIVSSPCRSQINHTIFVGCLNGSCHAINEKDASSVWRVQLGSPIFSNPALINAEKQVLFAEVRGLIHCLSTSEGNKVWVFHANGNIFSAFSILSDKVEEDQILFGCHDKNVYCLQQVHGTGIRLKWKTELDSSVYATPFVFPVKVTTGENTNLVAAVSTKGVIYLLNVSNGTRSHQLALPGEVFSSPIVHNDKLVVGCRDNNVYGIKLTTSNAVLMPG